MILECTGIAFIVAQLTCKQVDAPAPAARCAPIVQWSRDRQGRLADEINMNPGSELARAAIEYIGQRDVARACRAARSKR